MIFAKNKVQNSVKRHEIMTKEKDYSLLENVPVISCPQCGEIYLTAETLHEIERIKLHRKNFATKRHVLIADFV
ncbi:MAG: YgiT-type zinc finger protein [Thermodesulfobacteriota bacterium]|nr:YgiT-type zinc finger protein [Thermodesulfobacteriota bacterium]